MFLSARERCFFRFCPPARTLLLLFGDLVLLRLDVARGRFAGTGRGGDVRHRRFGRFEDVAWDAVFRSGRDDFCGGDFCDDLVEDTSAVGAGDVFEFSVEEFDGGGDEFGEPVTVFTSGTCFRGFGGDGVSVYAGSGGRTVSGFLVRGEVFFGRDGGFVGCVWHGGYFL